MYDITDGEGGYKYIWYLNEKPATNKVEFQIESSGLDFFYQPPLTQEYQNGYSEEFQTEIVVSETQVKDLDGNVLVERPENVVGSYAVYHQTKGGMNDVNGKEYKVSKAFHIFRPHIIDAEGKETWGLLHIENGIYSVEIPQDFLDKAVYPIKSNDDFGWTGIGSNASFGTGYIRKYGGGTKSPTNNGTVNSMTVYAAGNGGSRTAKIGIYAGTDLIDNGTVQEITISTSAGNKTNTFSTPPDVFSATAYAFGITLSGLTYCYYDTGSAGAFYASHTYANPLPDPVTWGGSSSYIFAIYATYTPSGGGEAPIINRNQIIE
jgi:hypothetical protein